MIRESTMRLNDLVGQGTPTVFQAADGLRALIRLCHGLAAAAGWWNDLKTGEPISRTDVNIKGCKIALIHSEVSEAFEGIRDGSMDKHLPHLTSEAVELADTVIRIMDYCGAYNIDLEQALVEKLLYNQTRADHKKENRALPGGKPV